MSSVVSQDPQILGGEPVFTGTRVPVKSLFDHLESGDSIEQFLEGFPSVKREQVIALLEEAREHALSAFLDASSSGRESRLATASRFIGPSCVVVEYAEDDAFVVTAYLTDKPKAGEDLWPIK
jgi:uncharacterized protein (DUF433 family)